MINGRFEIRRGLGDSPGHSHLLATDLTGDGRSCVITLYDGPPEKAYSHWLFLRRIFCPTLIRPSILQRSREDGRVFLVRPYVAGSNPSGRLMLEELRPQGLQMAESVLYLRQQACQTTPLQPGQVVVTGGRSPVAYLLDVLPDEDGATVGLELPPLEGPVPEPVLTRRCGWPLKLSGLDKAVDTALARARRMSESSPGCAVLIPGPQGRETASFSSEMLAALEMEGWRTLEFRTVPGRGLSDSLPELLRFLEEDDPGEEGLCVDMALDPSRIGEVRELHRVLGAVAGRWMVVVRSPVEGDAAPDLGVPSIEVDLSAHVPPRTESVASVLLGSHALPPGLQEVLDGVPGEDPRRILEALRSMIAGGSLRRIGRDWEYEPGPSGSSDDAITADRVTALLAHTASSLGSAAIAHVLGMEVSSVIETMNALSAGGRVRRLPGRGMPEWAPLELPHGPAAAGQEELSLWESRLVEYVLSSPSPSLSELLSAASFAEDDEAALPPILYNAFVQSREEGELDLTASLAGRMAGVQTSRYSLSEIEKILEVLEPSRMPGLDAEAMRPMLGGWLERASDPAVRTLCLARLAELDFLGGFLDEALGLLEEAISSYLEGHTLAWMGKVLSVAYRVFSAHGDTERLPSLVHPLVESTRSRLPGDSRVEVPAWAAAAVSLAHRRAEAEALLLEADSALHEAGPDAKQTFEICRGYVHLNSGELSQAAESFERALLLAENRKDLPAASEILGSLILCQERLPGYTTRHMAESMRMVLERAVASGNLPYRAFALSRLASLSTRLLDTAAAARLGREFEETGRGPATMERAHLEWHLAYGAFITGMDGPWDAADQFLEGTSRLLGALRAGIEDEDAARAVASSIRGAQSLEQIPAGIYLGLEALAAGFRNSASILGHALGERYRPRMNEAVAAWTLCIHGLQSARDQEAERALLSAQVTARQLDRLLLVRLILRARAALGLAEQPIREAEIALLLEELDRHLESHCEDPAKFSSQPETVRRRQALARICGSAEGTLQALRDSAAAALEASDAFEEGLRPLRPAYRLRSEVVWGLETLADYSDAMRVSILDNTGGSWTMLESRGFGVGLSPSPEMIEAAASSTGDHAVMDHFGSTPYGARMLHAVALGRVPDSFQGEDKRSPGGREARGSYLVIEADSPFDTLSGEREAVLLCLARQIGAAFALVRLERQTQHDQMTGARMAAVWFARLRDMLASGCVGVERPVSVLMLDLDYFKMVNDTFGHRDGDILLRQFVETVSGVLRPHDSIGRLGGEEFGVILSGASERNAFTVAERIRQKVAATVLRPDRRPVTVSIGVAVAPLHGESAELILRRADVALYESKDRGRDRTTVWNPSMSSTFTGRHSVSLLETGDPGWDLQLGRSALKLSLERVMEPEAIADELRNSLRCEYIRLDSGGSAVQLGSQEAVRGIVEAGLQAQGGVREGISPDRRFYAIRADLGDVGITAAWRASDALPRGLGPIVRAFANLAGSILGQAPSPNGGSGPAPLTDGRPEP